MRNMGIEQGYLLSPTCVGLSNDQLGSIIINTPKIERLDGPIFMQELVLIL